MCGYMCMILMEPSNMVSSLSNILKKEPGFYWTHLILKFGGALRLGIEFWVEHNLFKLIT